MCGLAMERAVSCAFKHSLLCLSSCLPQMGQTRLAHLLFFLPKWKQSSTAHVYSGNTVQNSLRAGLTSVIQECNPDSSGDGYVPVTHTPPRTAVVYSGRFQVTYWEHVDGPDCVGGPSLILASAFDHRCRNSACTGFNKPRCCSWNLQESANNVPLPDCEGGNRS